ncbi:MAG: Eco57I restriction-modification methylase domain-containing protein [Micrococcaceae bacterium]
MPQNKLLEIENAAGKLTEDKTFANAESLVEKLTSLLGGEFNQTYKPLSPGLADSIEKQKKIFQKNMSSDPYRRKVDEDENSFIGLFYLNNKKNKPDIKYSLSSLAKWTPAASENSGEKVGIFFFITADNSVILAIEDVAHNIRILEVDGELTNTQKQVFSELNSVLCKRSRKEIFETLWDSLQLQSVNNNFYKGVAEFFADLVEHLNIEPFNKDAEANKLFASKLLGRLLFLWFLREEKVIPEFDKKVTEDSDKYYKKVLKPLFDKLATPTRYGDDKTLYLNGGLFSGDSTNNIKISFPPKFFAGIFEHFKDYNFTTDESSPDFEQVAIDPEMLGKVFESLLGTLVTGSGKDVRKSKGTFYTPREIVEYMCKESLKQHFYGKYSSEKVHTYIKNVIELNDNAWEKDAPSKPKELKLIEDLKQLKVLDPACGSGAFPMGMQQLLLKIYKRHDGPSFDAYQRKLSIIENNIYGSDIEPMAIEIAKLRAWLSLVVEYESNSEILPLPNLEFKYVCANSLIPLVEDAKSESDNYQDSTFEDELNDLRERFFNARSPKKKKGIIAQFRKYTSHFSLLETEGSRNQQLSTYNPFETGEAASFFDSKVMFGVDTFDIVIGNPPYIKEYTDKDAFNGLHNNPIYQGKMDLWYFFGASALDLLKPEQGVVAFIATSNWITNAGAAKFRDKILQNGKLLEFVDFGDFKVFDKAGIQTMIYLIRRSQDNTHYSFDYSKVLNSKINNDDVKQFLTKIIDPRFTYFKTEINKQESLGSTLNFNNSKVNVVLESITQKADTYLLDNEVAQGIVAPQDYLNKKSQNILGDDFKIGDGVFNLSFEEYNSLNLDTNEKSIVKPFYTTEQLHRFYANSQHNAWVIYTDSSFKNPQKISSYPRLKAHLDKFQPIITSSNKPYGLHRARSEQFFVGEKIISLRKCQKPQFTYADFDTYVSQTYFSIKTDRIDMKALTVILNSKVVAFWLRYKGKMQGDMYQVDKAPLLKIPIVLPNNSIEFTSLTEEMIALMEQKYSSQTRFRRLIESEFNINKIPNQWWTLNFTDFISALKLNMSPTQEDNLLQIFDKYQDELSTLDSQIQSADRQANQIVYQLYKLTPEEISIVESTAS